MSVLPNGRRRPHRLRGSAPRPPGRRLGGPAAALLGTLVTWAATVAWLYVSFENANFGF
ncbi:hypothetical protein ACFV2N_36850 [Streptomyces sp. NPDC059680]|uniref:hypothetical protein n=1 Tax=Streptomyces sp. NPDC059680 TaxID=3346904 RepID=UPI0036BD1AFC